MKFSKASNNAIRRLPRYLRKLDELNAAGVTRISSEELGRQLGLTPSQIRQDLCSFGKFGQQGYGYSIENLRNEIAMILGMDRGFPAVLIGVGNIGHALMCNFNFDQWGFKLKAAFDIKPELIETEVGGVIIHDMKNLGTYLTENEIDIAVLCVPKEYAVETTELLVNCGVNAIWNFTNVELTSPYSSTIVENIHFSDSLLSLGYFVAQDKAEKAVCAARMVNSTHMKTP